MARFFALLLGMAAALTLPGAVWAQEEHQTTEHLNRAQLEYGVMPRPNPRVRWYWDAYSGRWVLRRPSYTNTYYGRGRASSDYWNEPPDEPNPTRRATARSSKHTASKTSTSSKASTSHAAGKTTASAAAAGKGDKLAKVDDSKPLTPAEIRTAVPVKQLKDPKAVLAKAKIKSLWGDVSGHVQNVAANGAGIQAIEADVGSAFGEKQHVVKLNPDRLKFIRSRNILMTTLTKPQLAKLPTVNGS